MLIVPTLRVGMPLGTLRVPAVTCSIVEHGCDAERHGLHSHAERGNDQVVAAGLFAIKHSKNQRSQHLRATESKHFLASPGFGAVLP
ncbi:hypothetical protein E5170_05930 [Pseudomonas atacamensis]|uniref:Uncharacterized protein n=1 Tax=Pseudomonas atacamensis TaxID=2565368 RepID=A0AAQ2DDJ4_9PSED|nr:hypothetical protein E5170_05930 [Pseudomonas atacamensis]